MAATPGLELSAMGAVRPPADSVVKAAQRREQQGFDAIWWADHLLHWFPLSIWTPELIALCHPLPIERVGIEVAIDAEAGEVRITGEVETIARTGVEMEALTAVSVAALNVYDMVKGIDKGVVVDGIRLLEKTKGGP